MFYKKSGYRQEDEIVLCKVTKIYPNSVFVNLLEYRDSGIIHISEVSPGRIRNLRDYVSEGRQIICKILRIDKEKGHIDLSLRRVNSNQRREKLDEIKQEIKAESIVKNLAKKLKLPVEKLYQDLTKALFKEYSHLHLAFKDVADGDADLLELNVPKKIAEELQEVIAEKFKPKKIVIEGEIRLKTYESNGVTKIKAILHKIEKIASTITLFYLGAGRFKFLTEESDYKVAEKNVSEVEKLLEKFNDKLSQASFIRV